MTGAAFQTFAGATWVQNPQWAARPGLVHGTLARTTDDGSDLTGKLALADLVPLITPPLLDLVQFGEETLMESSRDRSSASCREERSSAPDIVAADQVHGDAVAVISDDAHLDPARPLNPGSLPWSAVHEFPACDALVTTRPREILVIQTADCLPVLLWDPATRIAGACHCGWKGVLARLAAGTVERMIAAGARRGTLQAWIGPGICAENYEVGPDLTARFQTAFPNARVSADGLHLDLCAATVAQLVESGIAEGRIGLSGACTFGEQELYHSYRRDGARAGRLVTVIGLLD